MRRALMGMLILLFGIAGCSQKEGDFDPGLTTFIAELKAQGVDGNMTLRVPDNDDIEYITEYAISRYSSTRIISLLKCKTVDKAEEHLQDALKNSKLSGQARNGRYLMVATFYPAEEVAVAKIKAIFLAHKFE